MNGPYIIRFRQAVAKELKEMGKLGLCDEKLWIHVANQDLDADLDTDMRVGENADLIVDLYRTKEIIRSAS